VIAGDGADLLQCVGSLLGARRREQIMTLVDRTLQWIEEGSEGRRSINGLSQNRREREEFARLAEEDPVAIEVALLRAQREMSDAPLLMRIGITEVEKQAHDTDDVWGSNELQRQRGAKRVRDGRLMLVTSKHLAVPTLPGATAVVEPKQHPHLALARVMRAIREADPEAWIVDIDLDYFEECVCEMHKETRPPFCLQVPRLVQMHPGTAGPLGLFLSPSPAVSNTAIDGSARDLKGLRVGRRGGWSDPYHTDVEGPAPDGTIVHRPVTVTVSEGIRVHSASGGFHARVARVAVDRRDGVRLSAEPALVAVLDEPSEATIVGIAAANISATDDHPRIAEFIAARAASRVFRGEQHARRALHVDRAVAAIALAAHRLDEHIRTAAPAFPA
jgi:hypothetical protein